MSNVFSSRSTSNVAVQNKLLRNVYLWMFAGLVVSAGAAFAVTNSQTLMKIFIGNSFGLIALFIAEIALVWYLSAKITKMSLGTAILAFLGYAVLNGVVLSTIFFVYTASTISMAFLTAAAAFAAMSIYGTFTKRDLSQFSTIFRAGLFGIIIVSIIAMIFQLSGLMLIISYVGVFLFMGLTAWDTQRIIQMTQKMDSSDEMAQKLSIIGALTLYLDFINMFLFLLRIFGGRD